MNPQEQSELEEKHDAPIDRLMDTINRLRQRNLKWMNDYSAIKHQRDALRECLKEAWMAGSDHRRPTFEQLNKWREALVNPRIKL